MPRGHIKYGTVTIYALCEPDLWQAVRYVGATERTPQERLKQHLAAKELRLDTPKAKWLRELTARGRQPILRILEEVDPSEWEAAEKKWIAYYREQGAALTNVGDGGANNFPALDIKPNSTEAYLQANRAWGLRRRIDPPDSQAPDAIRRAKVRERLARWRERQRAKRSA